MGSDLFWDECSRKLDLYAQLREEGLRLLQRATADYPIHSYESRVKDRTSIEKKLLSRGITPDDNNVDILERELTDLLGLRVICFFRHDVYEIADELVRMLHVVERDDKDYLASATGYQSLHLLAKLPRDYHGERYDRIKSMVFEVQIRTINMDAWAKLSHLMPYKSEQEIPIELRAAFKALAGLYYVADTDFEHIHGLHAEFVERNETGLEAILPQPLTLETLVQYLDMLSERVADADEAVDLLDCLRERKLTKVSEVAEIVTAQLPTLVAAESMLPCCFTASGLVRGSIALNFPGALPALRAQIEEAYAKSQE